MKGPTDLAAELGLPRGLLERVASAPKRFYIYRSVKISKKVRQLRIPRGEMLAAQKAIKKKILDPMPLPPSVHGWRRRRSPKTYSRPHVRRSFILNVDIRDFFPSVEAGRVHRMWRERGYSDGAARLLTLLTTVDNQLPQGAPTSQAVGNQVLLPLHKRLSALAEQHGLKYSAYGDEVCLSGRRRVRRLKGLVLRIIAQEGFQASPGKVKEMPREGKQELAGVVVNKKTSVGRTTYRKLRAILHNCVTRGPGSQNTKGHPRFKEHLRGKIAHVQGLSPRLGDLLLAQFNRIQWPSPMAAEANPPAPREARQ